MNKYIILLLSIFAVACSSQNKKPQYVDKNQKMSAHPRLFMAEGSEDAIKEGIAKDEFWTEAHDLIISEADAMLTKADLKHKVVGRRLLGVSRDAVGRVAYLSYAYRMTGDEKYAKRAEHDMLTAASFPDWNPSHFLDASEMTTALAIGYDWLNSYLSESSKDSIANAMVRNALEVSLNEDEFEHWMENINNWNQVCHTGLALGAIVTWERNPELSQYILNRTVTNIRIPMGNYAPDGAYAEGPNYWEYGTIFNILLIDALNGATGQNYGLSDSEGFGQTINYAYSMITPTGKLFNYGDSPMNPSFYVAPFWFARNFGAEDKLHPFFHKMPLSKHRFLPLAVIWGHSFSSEKNSVDKNEMWKADGSIPVAAMRSGWDGDDVQYVGVKLGKSSISHAHLDVGSFFYEAYGVRWAIDLGAENYNTLEAQGVDVWNKAHDSQRWLVYKYHNKQHNVATINNGQQNVGERADFTSISETADSMSVTATLTDLYTPYIEAYDREVTLKTGEQAVFVRDTWTAGKTFTHVDWTMMSEAVPSMQGEDLLLTKDGVSVLLKAKHSSAAAGSWYFEPATPVYAFDSYIPGVYKIVYKLDLDLKAENKLEVSITKQ